MRENPEAVVHPCSECGSTDWATSAAFVRPDRPFLDRHPRLRSLLYILLMLYVCGGVIGAGVAIYRLTFR